MRHPVAEYREQVRRGFSMPRRLLGMLFMLAIVSILMYNASRPSTWQFFAKGGTKEVAPPPDDPTLPATKTPPAKPGKAQAALAPQAEAKTAAPAASEPAVKPAPKPAELVATGPTDEDEFEKQAIEETRGVIEDGKLGMDEAEMTPYQHVLGWVKHQPLPLLRERARKDVVYNDFISQPEQMRFQLVELEMQVWRILPAAKMKGMGNFGKMYEVWGSTDNSGTLLYTALVIGLPEGIPTGLDLKDVNVRLVGYFFKLQGYYSGFSPPDAQSGRDRKAPPLKAPMLIGRLVWVQSPIVKENDTPPWVWGVLSIAGAIVIVVGVVVAASMGRRNVPRSLSRLASYGDDQDAVSVDEWLDGAQKGEVILGNKFPGGSESSSGRADYRREAPGEGENPKFPGDFDTIGR